MGKEHQGEGTKTRRAKECRGEGRKKGRVRCGGEWRAYSKQVNDVRHLHAWSLQIIKIYIILLAKYDIILLRTKLFLV